MKRGQPVIFWDNAVRAWLAGRCRAVPHTWQTFKGQPRCVRCSVPLQPHETARRLQRRLRSCDECLEEVEAVISSCLKARGGRDE